MQVASSKINFVSQHYLKEEYRQSESLLAQSEVSETAENGEQKTNRRELLRRDVSLSREERQLALSRQEISPDEQVDISARASALRESLNISETESRSLAAFLKKSTKDNELDGLDAEIYQLKSIVESFTGREIKLSHIRDDVEVPESGNRTNNRSTEDEPEVAQNTASLIYRYQESYLEEEASQFNASGTITLQSGDTLDINFSQYAERSFYLENSLELEIGSIELQDPLIVNLAGNSAELTNEKSSFDLTSDGKQESIYFTTGQSGFLALDKNANGEIDDGAELFGAKTGNGFKELAAYDEDRNGFIDAGDSVFNQLQFYQKDSEGKDSIRGINELGIGALYLGSDHTPFQIKDAENQTKAVVRSSGFFLNENGTVGSLQQVDLVV